uniref:Trehalase n=1 Tax=Tetradesmus obliquus TaxID=3088 RepID=A0A383VBB9_TETOB|eukprot:jgi/Sobl393_1/6791/SZX62243.1
MNSNSSPAGGNATGNAAAVAASPTPNTAAGTAAAGNATATAAANNASNVAAGNAAGSTAGSNATGNTAAGNTAAGNAAPAASPTPYTAAGDAAAAGNATAAAAAAAGNTPAAAAVFPGYPTSGGLLLPQLQPLLLAVQEAHLYNDSKTAVDLVLKNSPADTLAAFQQLAAANSSSNSSGSNSSIDRAALQQFVNEQLDAAGSDLQQCVPPDWQQRPARFLPNLTAAAAAGDANATQLLQFGLDVHALWRVLCRQVSPAVAQHPERHSLLPLPNRTVVPGDRFRETYYWDSYWVVRGLLVSGMTETAAGLVGNLLSMLEAVGHVPNGARIYYLNRSQPPLLSAMVRELYEAAPQADPSLLSRALPLLLREHAYWTTAPKQVTISAANGTTYNLSRYYADWQQPRPESYREDVATAANATNSSSSWPVVQRAAGTTHHAGLQTTKPWARFAPLRLCRQI